MSNTDGDPKMFLNALRARQPFACSCSTYWQLQHMLLQYVKDKDVAYILQMTLMNDIPNESC